MLFKEFGCVPLFNQITFQQSLQALLSIVGCSSTVWCRSDGNLYCFLLNKTFRNGNNAISSKERKCVVFEEHIKAKLWLYKIPAAGIGSGQRFKNQNLPQIWLMTKSPLNEGYIKLQPCSVMVNFLFKVTIDLLNSSNFGVKRYKILNYQKILDDWLVNSRC